MATLPDAGVWVAGVDGCRAGWVVVLRHRASGRIRACMVESFAGVLELPEAPAVIGVDIPIGLPATARPGGRGCEVLARKRLGPRASSVFSAPSRRALDAYRAGAGYRAVSAANRGEDATGPGLSKQTFNILPKIAEVDAVLRANEPVIVREVHPELSFTEANGGTPMQARKKELAGRVERVRILERLGFADPDHLLPDAKRKDVARDDVLDACIACWTAGRIAEGKGIVLPEDPPRDARGLRMELWC